MIKCPVIRSNVILSGSYFESNSMMRMIFEPPIQWLTSTIKTTWTRIQVAFGSRMQTWGEPQQDRFPDPIWWSINLWMMSHNKHCHAQTPATFGIYIMCFNMVQGYRSRHPKEKKMVPLSLYKSQRLMQNSSRIKELLSLQCNTIKYIIIIMIIIIISILKIIKIIITIIIIFIIIIIIIITIIYI